MCHPERKTVPLKFNISRLVLVDGDRCECDVNYKATAIDEQTAIKGIVAALRSVANDIERRGFPYKEVTVSEPKSTVTA